MPPVNLTFLPAKGLARAALRPRAIERQRPPLRPQELASRASPPQERTVREHRLHKAPKDAPRTSSPDTMAPQDVGLSDASPAASSNSAASPPPTTTAPLAHPDFRLAAASPPSRAASPTARTSRRSPRRRLARHVPLLQALFLLLLGMSPSSVCFLCFVVLLALLFLCFGFSFPRLPATPVFVLSRPGTNLLAKRLRSMCTMVFGITAMVLWDPSVRLSPGALPSGRGVFSASIFA